MSHSGTDLVPVILPEAAWQALPEKLVDPFFVRLAEGNRLALRAYESTRGGDIMDIPADLARTGGARIQWNWRALKGRILRAAIECRLGGADLAWPIAQASVERLLDPATWSVEYDKAGLRHFDLKIADLLTTTVLALEGLAPWLDESERTGLLARLREDGLGAYLRGCQVREWWFRANFNWAAATHSAAGQAALAFSRYEADLAGRVLVEVEAGVRHLLRYLPEGGWWFEGSMYHTTTLGHLSDFVMASVLARGDDLGLSGDPRFLDALTTRPACLAPDGKLFNFSNCPECPDEWYLPQAYWWAERLGRPEIAAFEDTRVKPWHDASGVFYDVEAFFHRPAQVSSAPLGPPPTPPALVHFRGLDWVTWRGPTAWAAFRSGFLGSNHNNADLGHFILGRGETRYLIDPGYGQFHTNLHNAVTVRGGHQTDCATARITRLESLGATGFHLVCDLREAYPLVLALHERHLVVSESGGLLIDRLAVRPGLPTRFWCAAHFQTWQDVAIEGTTARLAGPAGGLALVPLTPLKPPMLSSTVIARQNDRQISRHLVYQPIVDEDNLLFAWRIDFGGVPVALTVHHLDAAGISFTTEHGRHEIAFHPS